MIVDQPPIRLICAGANAHLFLRQPRCKECRYVVFCRLNVLIRIQLVKNLLQRLFRFAFGFVASFTLLSPLTFAVFAHFNNPRPLVSTLLMHPRISSSSYMSPDSVRKKAPIRFVKSEQTHFLWLWFSLTGLSGSTDRLLRSRPTFIFWLQLLLH